MSIFAEPDLRGGYDARMRKKLLVALVLGGAASLLVLLLERAGGVDRFEGVTWNWRARALARPGAATDRIRLILLDQSSLNWAKKEYAASWPWMRQMYAPVLAFCRRGGARSVAFDVLFTEPSRDGVEDDRLLGAAMAEAPGFVGTVILGAGEEHSQWPDWLAVPSGLQEGAPHIPAALKSHLVAGTATFPVAETATNTVVLSNVIEQPDEDGLFRRITPLRVFDGRWVPALGMASWVASELRQGRPPALRVDDRAVWMGAHCIPTAADGRALLRYRGASRTHRTYTAAQIIQSELLLAEGRPPLVDPADFKDTHVFFGFSAPGLLDLRPTPVARAYPGVEIHATALDNLLSGDFIRPVSRTVSWSVTLLLAVLGAGVVLAGRRAWHSAAAMVAGVPGLPLALGFAAYAQGWEWPVAGPLLTLLVSMTGALVYNYATEGRQKAFIKSAFRHYLGPEVIEQILEDPSRLKLGGEKRELTIFFSDIEKFSTFSERLDPRDLTALLNEYLTEMGAIIREEGGYLDKYIGDAIVAFWNAPLAQPDHAARAVRAALRCQQRLAERRADYESRYGAVVKMRIGLHTGRWWSATWGRRTGSTTPFSGMPPTWPRAWRGPTRRSAPMR